MDSTQFLIELSLELVARGRGNQVAIIMRNNGATPMAIRQKAYDAYVESKKKTHDGKMDDAVRAFSKGYNDFTTSVANGLLQNLANRMGLIPPQEKPPQTVKVEQLGGFPNAKRTSKA